MIGKAKRKRVEQRKEIILKRVITKHKNQRKEAKQERSIKESDIQREKKQWRKEKSNITMSDRESNGRKILW